MDQNARQGVTDDGGLTSLETLVQKGGEGERGIRQTSKGLERIERHKPGSGERVRDTEKRRVVSRGGPLASRTWKNLKSPLGKDFFIREVVCFSVGEGVYAAARKNWPARSKGKKGD